MANVAKSGASYTAELVDKITAPIQRINRHIDGLTQKLNGLSPAARSANQSLQQVNTQLQGLQKSADRVVKLTNLSVKFFGIYKITQMLTRGLMSLSRTLIQLGSDFVKVAGDANETENAFNAVFKSRSKGAGKYFKDLSREFGRAIPDVQKTATAFQSMFVGLGAGADNANKLSASMTRLTYDFASFFNIQDSDAQQRFIAALAGSTEVLDRFGINIRENQAELKGQELGFGDNIRNMTEYQKALVRVNLILETMKRQGAVGDVVRTSQEWVNQTKALNGAWTDLRATIGQGLLQGLLPHLRDAVTMIQNMNATLENTEGAIWKIAGAMSATVKILKEIVALSARWASYATGTSGPGGLPKSIPEMFGGKSLMGALGDAFVAVANAEASMLENAANKVKEGRDNGLGEITGNVAEATKREQARVRGVQIWENIKAQGQAVADALEETKNRIRDIRKKLYEDTRRPMEIFAKQTNQFMQMFKAGNISREVRDRAILNAARNVSSDDYSTPAKTFKELANRLQQLFLAGDIGKDVRDQALLIAAKKVPEGEKKTFGEIISQGGYNALFASQTGRFAPAMTALEREAKDQTRLLQVIADNTGINNVNPLVFQ